MVFFEIEQRVVIIASMGGSDKHPTWYINLNANPDAKIEIGGGKFNARAVTVTGDDRENLFAEVCRTMPVFADYQNKTQRVIPVVELKRID